MVLKGDLKSACLSYLPNIKDTDMDNVRWNLWRLFLPKYKDLKEKIIDLYLFEILRSCENLKKIHLLGIETGGAILGGPILYKNDAIKLSIGRPGIAAICPQYQKVPIL